MRGGIRLVVVSSLLFAVLGEPSAAPAATAWATQLGAGSRGAAQAQGAPAAPDGVTATCTTPLATTVDVAWNPVISATTYTILASTTSSSTGFAPITTGVVGTTWTSPALATGSYWFEVVAYVGTNWASANSSASTQRLITVVACLEHRDGRPVGARPVGNAVTPLSRVGVGRSGATVTDCPNKREVAGSSGWVQRLFF